MTRFDTPDTIFPGYIVVLAQVLDPATAQQIVGLIMGI